MVKNSFNAGVCIAPLHCLQQTSWFIAAMVRMLAVYYYSYMTGERLFRGLGVLASE
jgi:hypothetical protein